MASYGFLSCDFDSLGRLELINEAKEPALSEFPLFGDILIIEVLFSWKEGYVEATVGWRGTSEVIRKHALPCSTSDRRQKVNQT